MSKKNNFEKKINKAGSILGRGLDWYFGADVKKGGRSGSLGGTGRGILANNNSPQKMGGYSSFLMTGKKPKTEQEVSEEKKKNRQEIHIHIHS